MRSMAGLVILLAAMGVSLAWAADDPISERRKLMQKVGRAEQHSTSVILGKFLPEKATKAMVTIQDLMATFPSLFPDGSETGGETKASPAIWSDREEFEALAAKTIEDAKAAEAAISNGPDAFAVAWQMVAENCHSCHAAFTQGMMIR